MAAIYSNGGNRWNILGFNFTKRDALSSVYEISMVAPNTKDRSNAVFDKYFVFISFSRAKNKSFSCN
jgi:hypothetical protein